MSNNSTTEIRSFYSLQDLRESVKEQKDRYQELTEEYSQWLGSFLRELEFTHGKEEWFKNMPTLQSLQKKPVRKEEKKKGGKEKASSTEWVPIKGIMLSSSEQGEVEILFDAIEELKRKVEQLSKVNEALEDLERLALGKEIIYVTYINNGVPEKIVLRHQKGSETQEKFKFLADFSVLKET